MARKRKRPREEPEDTSASLPPAKTSRMEPDPPGIEIKPVKGLPATTGRNKQAKREHSEKIRSRFDLDVVNLLDHDLQPKKVLESGGTATKDVSEWNGKLLRALATYSYWVDNVQELNKLLWDKMYARMLTERTCDVMTGEWDALESKVRTKEVYKVIEDLKADGRVMHKPNDNGLMFDLPLRIASGTTT